MISWVSDYLDFQCTMEQESRQMLWDRCVLCQIVTSEEIKQPVQNRGANHKEIKKTYTETAGRLKEFAELRKVPKSFHSLVSRYSLSGELGQLMIENEAVWHPSCRKMVSESKLQKLKTVAPSKRKSVAAKSSDVEAKKTRSHLSKFNPNQCFVPGCTTETIEEEPLHKVMSKELDNRFSYYTEVLNDTELLAKLAGGDLIAQEAKYHSTCAVKLYNRVRSKLREENTSSAVPQGTKSYEEIAFLHLVSDVEEYRYDIDVRTFILSDLIAKYENFLTGILPAELGSPQKPHSTRFKNKLLSEIPDLQYFKKGKQGYLAFNSQITELLQENVGVTRDEIEALCDAVRILRQGIFRNENLLSSGQWTPMSSC